MKRVRRFHDMTCLHAFTRLFQAAATFVLICMLGNISMLEPVWAQNNVARISMTYQPGTDGDTVTFLSVDGNLLDQPEIEANGVMQDSHGPIPIEMTFSTDELGAITVVPLPPDGPSKKKSYAIYEDGELTTYQLVLATYVDDLKADSLLHSGTITDTATGRTINFVALNDPIPVIVIISLIAAIVCVISILINDCTSQARAACGAGGVKSVKAHVHVSLRRGCGVDCEWECYPPPARPTAVATVVPN
jgi:hypothetical protein